MRGVLSARVLMAFGMVVVLASGVMVARQRTAGPAMTAAATAFLETLTPEQRQQAVFPLGGDERTRWHFVPTNMFPRNGVPLKAMTEPQRAAAHALLNAALSQRGYMTATAIMELEVLLRQIEAGRGNNIRDPELYYVSIFGTPSGSSPWGLRVEGHHLSLHFSVDGTRTQVSTGPMFFGSNPAEIRIEHPRKGERILGEREDAARAFVAALTEAQRTAMIVAVNAPGDIATTTQPKVDPLTPAGLLGADLTPAQRDLLVKLIEVYTGAMADDVGADRIAKFREAGVEKIGFAWAGSLERGQRFHYRVQGPTFLIEHNNTQNQGNHVHSVWRDFNGDFGRDLIAEHMAAVQH